MRAEANSLRGLRVIVLNIDTPYKQRRTPCAQIIYTLNISNQRAQYIYVRAGAHSLRVQCIYAPNIGAPRTQRRIPRARRT